MRINLFRIQFDGIIQMLKEYQRTMENQLSIIQKEESDRIDALLKAIEDEDERYIEEVMAGDDYHYNYEIMIPRSHRYSFLVLLYLNLENLLTRFSDSVKKRDNLPIRANDLNGDVITRNRKYLHKLAKVPDLSGGVWDTMEDLSKVRNCIVHGLGELEKSQDQKRLLDIAAQGHGLSIGHDGLDDGFLVLTDEYCEKAVNDIARLFQELFDKAGYAPSKTP